MLLLSLFFSGAVKALVSEEKIREHIKNSLSPEETRSFNITFEKAQLLLRKNLILPIAYVEFVEVRRGPYRPCRNPVTLHIDRVRIPLSSLLRQELLRVELSKVDVVFSSEYCRFGKSLSGYVRFGGLLGCLFQNVKKDGGLR